jgi:hypothetical protein
MDVNKLAGFGWRYAIGLPEGLAAVYEGFRQGDAKNAAFAVDTTH